jgi:hypothetical protein
LTAPGGLGFTSFAVPAPGTATRPRIVNS